MGEWQADYSDAKTAASRKVHVRVVGETLLIADANGAAVEIWPLEKIRTAAHGASLVMALEGFRSRLRIGERGAIRDLRRQMPHIRRPHKIGPMRLSRWMIGLIAAGVALVAMGSALVVFPTIALAVLPAEWFSAVGRRYAEGLAPSDYRCGGKDGLAALEQAAHDIGASAGSDRPVAVWVVNAGIRNAFATAGGHVVLFRGLIETTEKPSELIGVLAHEIGHVVAQHPEKALVRSIGFTAIVQALAMGLGIDPDAAAGGAALAHLQYSRDAERDADDFAVQAMEDTGYDPAGLAATLAKIGGDNKAGDGEEAGNGRDDTEDWFPVMLASHPATEDRIERINRRKRADASRDPISEADWIAIKQVCADAGPPASLLRLLIGRDLPEGLGDKAANPE